MAAAPGPSAAASVPAPTTAAPPPSLVDAAAALQIQCARIRAKAPPLDRPEHNLYLRDCDAEAFYYGIGRPPDYARARECAYAQLAGDAPVFGGAGILMMIYANGEGVQRNFNLAARFACTSAARPRSSKDGSEQSTRCATDQRRNRSWISATTRRAAS